MIEEKLGEELKKSKEAEKMRKAKSIEDAKELRELEKKLEMLRKQNDLAEMGRKRSGTNDLSDENLNKKKPLAGDMTADRAMADEMNPHRAPKTKESGAGMTSSPSNCSNQDQLRRDERMRCTGEAMMKQERQESWEPSDLEESSDIRSTQHEKPKEKVQAKKGGSSSPSKRSLSKMKSF